MNEDNHLEFDTAQLISALKSGLDINSCEPSDLEEILVKEREEVIEEVDNVEASMNIASIGGEYSVGPLSMSVVLGNLVLLSSIDSPLVGGTLKQGDTLSFNDCAEALYVLSEGKKVIGSIMSIAQRISDLERLKPLIKGNPEMMDKIINKAEEISKARVQFTKDAIDFYEEKFVGYDFEEIINSMISSVSDVLMSSSNLPSPEVGSITPSTKKN